MCGSIRGGQSVGRRHGGYGSYTFSTSTPSTVYISLHKCFVCGQVREVVGAISCMMVFKEITAFDTTFIIIQEFAFGIEKFRALFSQFRGSGRGNSRGTSGRRVVVKVRREGGLLE